MTTTNTPAVATSRTRVGQLGTALVSAGVLALAASGCAGPSVDRSNAAQTAAAFTAATARGDGSACELATAPLRSSLQRQGHCDGSAQGPNSQVTVLFAKDCGDKSLTGLQVDPAGAVGGRYALVALQRDAGSWAAGSMTPMQDREAVQPGECG